MSGCLFSPEAEADLVDIVSYVAAKNPVAARKLFEDIQSACSKLAHLPMIGHQRPDLTDDPDTLFFCVQSYYLVIYRKETDPLQIIRVLHGARDVASEL